MATTTKLRGVVKTLKRPEGYGFILDPVSGLEYFFHRRLLEQTTKPWDTVEEEDAVEFIPVSSPKGLRAIEVRFLPPAVELAEAQPAVDPTLERLSKVTDDAKGLSLHRGAR